MRSRSNWATYTVRGWPETQAQIFPSLSCASGGVPPLLCLPAPPHSERPAPFQDVPMGLTQHGQADQQQEPHASAGVGPSAQAPGESSLGGGPPPLQRPTRMLPGRCLQQRDNLEATAPQGLSNQGWAQNSRLPTPHRELGGTWVLEPKQSYPQPALLNWGSWLVG